MVGVVVECKHLICSTVSRNCQVTVVPLAIAAPSENLSVSECP